MTLHDVWNDPVWSKVIGGVITAVILGSSRILKWPKRFWVPRLRKTHTLASEQIGAMYPLKYYLEVINDSRKCVEVRVSEFVGDVASLQKFVQSTLQVLFDGKWFPTDLATEAVALLPNQRCRAWIGVDAKKFTKADLEHWQPLKSWNVRARRTPSGTRRNFTGNATLQKLLIKVGPG